MRFKIGRSTDYVRVVILKEGHIATQRSRAAGRWVDEYDLVIVGSGAGSICAALVARLAGKRAVILEKTDLIGGSTAMSGGVLWVPNSAIGAKAGVEDSFELAWTYLEACIGHHGPSTSVARRKAFLNSAPQAIDFLQRNGMKLVHAEGYSDYHESELPGGIARGRALVAPVFDVRRLGSWADRLRGLQGNLPITTAEVPGLTLYGGTWSSRLTMAKVAARMARNKLLGHRLVGTGAAVQGRLLEIALRHDIPIRLNAAVAGFIEEGGRIAGIELKNGDRIRACAGVLVNAGGFAQNQTMRNAHQPAPVSTEWTNANPGDTGEILSMLMDMGAGTDLMDLSWWVTISQLPNGSRPIHSLDISKPHAILVDASGERFVNESTSYLTVGAATYRRHTQVSAIPAWAILDCRHRRSYPWANHPPGRPPEEWIASGYMKCADSIEGLAAACGIDPAGLRATVDRFNGFADSGVDEDFGRGVSAYNRWLADPRVRPNGNLGRIDRPPFYAVALYPGDVGTAGGVITDEHARVLRSDLTPIDGLYASGNVAAPVTGRSYPGAGASIAASLVFGYLAALHAIGAMAAPGKHDEQRGEGHGRA